MVFDKKKALCYFFFYEDGGSFFIRPVMRDSQIFLPAWSSLLAGIMAAACSEKQSVLNGNACSERQVTASESPGRESF
jgi:hypothetical protein